MNNLFKLASEHMGFITLEAYQFVLGLQMACDPRTWSFSIDEMSEQDIEAWDALTPVLAEMRRQLEARGFIFDKNGNYVDPLIKEIDAGGNSRMRQDYEEFEGTHEEWVALQTSEEEKESGDKYFGASTLAKLRDAKLFDDED